jgi:hypothetical protein
LDFLKPGAAALKFPVPHSGFQRSFFDLAGFGLSADPLPAWIVIHPVPCFECHHPPQRSSALTVTA